MTETAPNSVEKASLVSTRAPTGEVSSNPLGPRERPGKPLCSYQEGCPEYLVTLGLVNLRFRMFLCSSSSAVGLWLSRLRKKSRKIFWTMSYPSGVGDLHGPNRYIRQSQQLESSVHPVPRDTDSPPVPPRFLNFKPRKGTLRQVTQSCPPSLCRPLPRPAPPVPPGQETETSLGLSSSQKSLSFLVASCLSLSASRLALASCYLCAHQEHRGLRPGGHAREGVCLPRTMATLLPVSTHLHQSLIRHRMPDEQAQK